MMCSEDHEFKIGKNIFDSYLFNLNLFQESKFQPVQQLPECLLLRAQGRVSGGRGDLLLQPRIYWWVNSKYLDCLQTDILGSKCQKRVRKALLIGGLSGVNTRKDTELVSGLEVMTFGRKSLPTVYYLQVKRCSPPDYPYKIIAATGKCFQRPGLFKISLRNNSSLTASNVLLLASKLALRRSKLHTRG